MVENLLRDIILGVDFLFQNNCVFNLCDNVMQIWKLNLRYPVNSILRHVPDSLPPAELFTLNARVLESLSVASVEVHSGMYGTSSFVNQSGFLSSNILDIGVDPRLVTLDKGRATISIINSTEFPRILHSDTSLAFLTSPKTTFCDDYIKVQRADSSLSSVRDRVMDYATPSNFVPINTSSYLSPHMKPALRTLHHLIHHHRDKYLHLELLTRFRDTRIPRCGHLLVRAYCGINGTWNGTTGWIRHLHPSLITNAGVKGTIPHPLVFRFDLWYKNQTHFYAGV